MILQSLCTVNSARILSESQPKILFGNCICFLGFVKFHLKVSLYCDFCFLSFAYITSFLKIFITCYEFISSTLVNTEQLGNIVWFFSSIIFLSAIIEKWSPPRRFAIFSYWKIYCLYCSYFRSSFPFIFPDRWSNSVRTYTGCEMDEITKTEGLINTFFFIFLLKFLISVSLEPSKFVGFLIISITMYAFWEEYFHY